MIAKPAEQCGNGTLAVLLKVRSKILEHAAAIVASLQYLEVASESIASASIPINAQPWRACRLKRIALSVLIVTARKTSRCRTGKIGRPVIPVIEEKRHHVGGVVGSEGAVRQSEQELLALTDEIPRLAAHRQHGQRNVRITDEDACGRNCYRSANCRAELHSEVLIAACEPISNDWDRDALRCYSWRERGCTRCEHIVRPLQGCAVNRRVCDLNELCAGEAKRENDRCVACPSISLEGVSFGHSKARHGCYC